MSRHPHPAPPVTAKVSDKISDALDRFLHVEALSGIVLLVAACIALGWANSTWADSYQGFWHAPLTFGAGAWMVTQPLHFWINDGLMAIFFLVVGLEIRRELHEGALASLRQAALPVAAALGGVLVPAIIFIAINSDPATRQGWAVPTATDIAFALGVLALLGKRIPATVRVLLLAIAIIDDIAAILIIALFYSGGIKLTGLAIVALGIVMVWCWQRLGIRSALAYLPPAFVVWLGLLYAGLHPTLAGVVLGLLTPVRPMQGRENPLARASHALQELMQRTDRRAHAAHEMMHPLKELQRAQLEMLPPVVRVQAVLHPWVAYGVMPLFALANAGVSLSGVGIDGSGESAGLMVMAGVTLGLVIGKPVGIVLVSLLMVKLGVCRLPEGLTWRGVLTVGCLAGIGFTMSIFISTLAFDDPALLAAAKLAVLIASTTAAVIGLIVGLSAFDDPRPRSSTRETCHCRTL
ncbi:Na+/H+ antiporter NhaA [Povalibacter sp.]|uniref:Na+/H+ antiporter NhaA n=1 Tax=Povalibacter sp. TaxID=1962978 RepID=UPI002F3EBE58